MPQPVPASLLSAWVRLEGLLCGGGRVSCLLMGPGHPALLPGGCTRPGLFPGSPLSPTPRPGLAGWPATFLSLLLAWRLEHPGPADPPA